MGDKLISLDGPSAYDKKNDVASASDSKNDETSVSDITNDGNDTKNVENVAVPSVGNPDESQNASSEPDCTDKSSGVVANDKSDVNPEAEDGPHVSDVNPEAEDDPHVQDMDIEDDLPPVKKDNSCDGTLLLPQSVTALGETCDSAVAQECENGANIKGSAILIDQSPTLGVKRARVSSINNDTSVRVVYSGLTRHSKKKLMEYMQRWSEWHAKHDSAFKDDETLECGEETYYPAIYIGSERSYTVSYWLDNQARKDDVSLSEESVPQYNREFTLGSTPLGDSATFDRSVKEDSRCFNCASYGHALKDCPKPRNNHAISNARREHNSKRAQSSSTRGQPRYYEKKTPGKFDDLKAGVLGPETRQCLGIGEHDPPPWLHRMRELGYPPGYLDVVEDDEGPSGITIFGDEVVKDEAPKDESEEGELAEKAEPAAPQKKMTVEFPGINAPIPENSDPWLWGGKPMLGFGAESASRSHHQHSEPSRSRYHDHSSRDQRDRTSFGTSSAFSPRYDYNHDPARSSGDRGWRGFQEYDSPSHTPRNSHLPPLSSRYSSSYHTPPITDRWDPRSGSSDTSPHHSSSRDRYQR